MNLPIEIDVQSVHSMLGSSDVALIDCREPSEWETARIDGAVLMPMSQWMQSIDRLAAFEGKRVVVHCHHGSRSLRIVHWLRQNGFPEAQNMTGGVDEWSQVVNPQVPRY